MPAPISGVHSGAASGRGRTGIFFGASISANLPRRAVLATNRLHIRISVGIILGYGCITRILSRAYARRTTKGRLCRNVFHARGSLRSLQLEVNTHCI
jgi:hypothetical protein